MPTTSLIVGCLGERSATTNSIQTCLPSPKLLSSPFGQNLLQNSSLCLSPSKEKEMQPPPNEPQPIVFPKLIRNRDENHHSFLMGGNRGEERQKPQSLRSKRKHFFSLLPIIILILVVMFLIGHLITTTTTPSDPYPIQIGGSQKAFDLWENSTGPIPIKTALPTQPSGSKPLTWSVIGKPTITAAFINKVLASYHSPAAGLGQYLYDYGVQYGLDPVYPLAFFMHESLFGTTGMARVTLGLGNSRCIETRPCINTQGLPCQAGQSCYAKMNSWQDGFEQWYKLIRNLYIAQWGRVTIDQI